MKSLLLSALAMATVPMLAEAEQPNCAPRAVVVERLTTGFGETRHAIGIATQSQVVELWGQEASGTWSIVVTLPDGRSCIVASGVALELLDEALLPTGAAT